MSITDTIKADAAAVAAAIESLFSGIKAKLVTFFSAGASAIAASIEQQLPRAGADIVAFVEQSALAAVAAAEAMPGTGEAKMAAALASLTASLATKGLALAETELRSLLENALLQFKSATASSGSGASTQAAVTSPSTTAQSGA